MGKQYISTFDEAELEGLCFFKRQAWSTLKVYGPIRKWILLLEGQPISAKIIHTRVVCAMVAVFVDLNCT